MKIDILTVVSIVFFCTTLIPTVTVA